MTQEKDSGFVPRAPRFKVSDTGELEVFIKRTEDGSDEQLSAELLDVSQHGTKLRVPVSLRFEEALQLRIQVANSKIEYHGIASVRHIRPVDDEHWDVGCAIAPPLPDETFSFLATTAGKERRRFRRLNIAAEATVRRQAQTEGVSASLHNLSSGGFCFSSADHYEVGEAVQLTLNGNDGEVRVIEARICWQVESPDGSISGCKFTSSESYADLCACLTEKPVLASNARTHEEPTSKLVLTAAVLAMFVPPMMTLMLQANKVSASAAVPVAELADCEEPEGEDASEHATGEPVDRKVLAELILESQPPADRDETKSNEETVEEPHLEQQQSPGQSTVREWVDNTGRYRTLAELIEVTPKHIVLLKADGKESKVPWDRLSKSDQEFARAWQGTGN